MDWNRIRGQWKSASDDVQPGDVLASVQQRDRKVREQLKRRDRLETTVAVLVAPFFAFAAWRAGAREAWVAAWFCVFLALWAAYVPLRLWHARRRLPAARHDESLLEYLRQERLAMLAQAHMLERIWVWYLAPCAIGVIGLNFAALGFTTGPLIYAAVVLAFCAVLARLNHYAARTQFRDLAAQIERQIAHLTEENGR